MSYINVPAGLVFLKWMQTINFRSVVDRPTLVTVVSILSFFFTAHFVHSANVVAKCPVCPLRPRLSVKKSYVT